MAYINTASNSSSFMARVSTIVDALATRRRQNRMFRQTFAELSELSNREMNDLGISRSEIRRIAIESSRNAL
ncbi:MAG: hypothetical protein CML61_11975 [Rhodobacteraceae bacterium]|nr:hypothetical protein [Paracoccaceae bacterium]